MTFSNDVKNELSHIEYDDLGIIKAELFGLFKVNGILTIKNHMMGMKFITDKAYIARRIIQLLKNSYNVKTEISVVKLRNLRKNNRYQINILPSLESQKIINDLCLLPYIPVSPKNNLLSTRTCKRAFLRGAFLASGNITNPIVDYHIDLTTKDIEVANFIVSVAKDFDLNIKTTDRKDDYIVYINNYEDVSDFLSIIGAHNALMDMGNIQILKSVRNDVNRKVNCETANLNKIVKTAVKQVESIKYIENTIGLHQLPINLQEAARIRLRHPDISMSELVDYFGGLGKSGINHRLKKLCEIAKSLGFKYLEN